MAGNRNRVRLASRGEHEWEFEFPRLDKLAYDKLHLALEEMEAGGCDRPEQMLCALVEEYPEFIDARHHLALLYSRSRRPAKALREWQLAVETGLESLPADFVFGPERMDWLWLDNRPFLRAYVGLALTWEERGMIGEACAIYENVLDLNPNDNQGVRHLALACFFQMRRPQRVLEFCNRCDYEDYVIAYGRVLALHMLGSAEEARAAAAEAAASFPHIAAEMRKTKHVRPKSSFPGYVTAGGADEAYEFWMRYGAFWSRSGAVDLLSPKRRPPPRPVPSLA
jgi:tetratricopeptide (TPR) repeat protein